MMQKRKNIVPDSAEPIAKTSLRVQGVWGVLIMAAILGLVILFANLFLQRARSTTLTDACYLKNGTVVESGSARWSLEYKQESGAILNSTKDNLSFLGTPVYCQKNGEMSVVLPEPYVLQCAGSVDRYIYQVHYFGTVTPAKDGEGFVIEDSSGRITVDKGLLYNGRDTYIFLEPARIVMDGYRREIPAFTTMIVRHANSVVIYEGGTNVSRSLLTLDSEMEVHFSKNRVLYPLQDMVLQANQTWMLMYGTTTGLMELREWKD